MDGKNAAWQCFRANCGWKGFVEPDGVLKLSQAKNNTECETDQDGEANLAVNKVYRKICEEDLHLEPLCDEVRNCFLGWNITNYCTNIIKSFLLFLFFSHSSLMNPNRSFCTWVFYKTITFWQLVTYFSERMISPETLRRNSVMQRNWSNKV
jgi:twinkle protein